MNKILEKLELGKINELDLKNIMMCGNFIKIEKCYLNNFRVTMLFGRSEEIYDIQLI